jgi:hypothetical protein
MHFVRAAAFLFLASFLSTAWSAPPDRKAVLDQQQQWIQDQQADDALRQPVIDLIKKYQPLHNRLGEIPGLRIAIDRISQLDQSRENRAAKFWESMAIALPLTQPLSEGARGELASFIATFGASTLGPFARGVMAEHDKLVQAELAKKMLEDLRLASTMEQLTAEQVQSLEEIDSKYTASDAASTARRYLRAHYARQSLAEIDKSGLVAAGDPEKLASQRLEEVRERFGRRWNKTRLLKGLTEIVEDYPETQAARQASLQMVDVRRIIDAENANARMITEYWDMVYPSRAGQPYLGR